MRKWLFVALSLITISISANAQKVYLVTAGVADYPGDMNDLNLPAEDARAVYRLYNKNTNAKSVLLTNENATRARIISSANSLYRNANPDDIVVFFFSGHGYKGGFVAYDSKLPYDDIRKVFANCKAKNKMVFADACFSGDIRNDSGANHKDSFANIMLFLSSRSNETSIERRDMKNGFFAACLVRALKGGADYNKDRVITAMELFWAVSQEVKKLSHDRQHPVMWGNYDNNMPVMIWK